MQAKETPRIKIGLEIHVPLKTNRKLFCDCPTNYYEVETPNVNICPVCTGMPGSKPFPINEKALESAVMVARLLNCKVSDVKAFVKRKHYDYPDLPSGYQRTSEPIGVDGELAGVGIWELHFEEDPGRFDLATGRVDYNRSGVPLIEIVTAPDMKSPEEARSFLKELINLLKYTERIIDVGGVMRADVNISLEGGARVEIKNVNSVKGVFKALNYEIIRQKNLMKRGGTVTQETRGFNEKSMITTSMRVKETADDYRYIPDPDIPPLALEKEYIDAIELPETPRRRQERLIEKYSIPGNYAEILVKEKDLADMFERIAPKCDPQIAADWISREVIRQLNYRGIELYESRLHDSQLIELFTMLNEKTLTENTGKKLLERVIDTGESPKEIVEKESLSKVSSEDALSKVAEEVLSENSPAVTDYRAGKTEVINYLMGQVMRKMKGRADSKVVIEILKVKLET